VLNNPEEICRNDEGEWVHTKCFNAVAPPIPRAALEAVVAELKDWENWKSNDDVISQCRLLIERLLDQETTE